MGYRHKLEEYIKETGITALFVSDVIDVHRTTDNGHKIYSLWDAYVFADIVTFPSIWEGWGNQFIEAIFAQKPVIVFEYPVFKSDVKQEGYVVISLGDKLSDSHPNGLVKLP